MIVQFVVSVGILNRQVSMKVPGESIRECRGAAVCRVLGSVWLEVWSTDDEKHVATRIGEKWFSEEGEIEAPL